MNKTACPGLSGLPDCESCPHYRIDIDDFFGWRGDQAARRMCPILRPDLSSAFPPLPWLVRFLMFLSPSLQKEIGQ